MAITINVTMKRTNPYGIVCNSTRPIVVWGNVPENLVDTLETELSTLRQINCSQMEGQRTQSDIIREVCDHLVPGRWDFLLQGGTVEF